MLQLLRIYNHKEMLVHNNKIQFLKYKIQTFRALQVSKDRPTPICLCHCNLTILIKICSKSMHTPNQSIRTSSRASHQIDLVKKTCCQINSKFYSSLLLVVWLMGLMQLDFRGLKKMQNLKKVLNTNNVLKSTCTSSSKLIDMIKYYFESILCQDT